MADKETLVDYVNKSYRRPLIFDMPVVAIFGGVERKNQKVAALVGVKTGKIETKRFSPATPTVLHARQVSF